MEKIQNLRGVVELLKAHGALKTIHDPVSPEYEAASIVHRYDGKAVLFDNIKGSDIDVIAGIGSCRDYYAHALGIRKDQLLHTLADAFLSDEAPPVADVAPCKENISKNPDLGKLPIFTHFKGDGGPYITSGVAIVRDPDLGQNMCFHRLMRTGKDTLCARIVENRGTHNALKKADGVLDVAICIGAPLHVLLAAACSPPPGHDEALIAQGLAPTPMAKAETSGLMVPALSEIVIEGTFTGEYDQEGPFVDLTQTPDVVRSQPVIKVKAITTRNHPIYHALMPSSLEHKLLMGMPKEPSIYNAARSVADVKNVLITPGGCSWLHAVLQIDPKGKDDAMMAARKAFEGHGSLKHCMVVDTDIDIYDSQDLEWALATRVQASRDCTILQDMPGSSLDPSASHAQGRKSETDKMIIDATIPYGEPRGEYAKVSFEPLGDDVREG